MSEPQLLLADTDSCCSLGSVLYALLHCPSHSAPSLWLHFLYISGEDK